MEITTYLGGSERGVLHGCRAWSANFFERCRSSSHIRHKAGVEHSAQRTATGCASHKPHISREDVVDKGMTAGALEGSADTILGATLDVAVTPAIVVTTPGLADGGRTAGMGAACMDGVGTGAGEGGTAGALGGLSWAVGAVVVGGCSALSTVDVANGGGGELVTGTNVSDGVSATVLIALTGVPENGSERKITKL
jgi:hypothetical protein